nr:hypothetical protein [uncultured Pseudomonas sp.]
MHPTIRENRLPLNPLPTLFLAVILSEVSTVIVQRSADQHFKQNRTRLAVVPPIIHERRLGPHPPAPSHSALSLNITLCLGAF